MKRVTLLACTLLFILTVCTILREIFYVASWVSGNHGFLRLTETAGTEQDTITFEKRDQTKVYVDLGVLGLLVVFSFTSFMFLIKSFIEEEEEEEAKQKTDFQEGPEYQKMEDEKLLV